MRIHAVAAIVLVSGLVIAADAPPKDAGKKELEKLQGTWVAVSAEAEGQKLPDAAIKGFKMVVKGNKMTFTPDIDKRESLFELNPAKTPKEIVTTPLDGPSKGKSLWAIYSFDKDLFKLCVNNEKDQLPIEFATRPGDGQRLVVLKRQRP